jgi:glycosyltransferase involved in cell wall biosynthesis
MRIIQILEATLGGTARHLIDLCAGLAVRGHEVHLLYNPRPGRMDGLFKAGLSRLCSHGVVASALPFMDRPLGRHDAISVRAVRHYLRSRGPFDIIHGHSSKGGAYARLASLGLPGRRIYTPHAFITAHPDMSRAGRVVYGMMERILARAAHAIICVSEDEKAHAAGLGLPVDRLFTVPNGADPPATAPDKASVRTALGLPPGAFIVGFVGRFVSQKDPGNLLRAFARLSSARPDARLALVGAGPLEGEMRSMARALGIDTHIDWLGVRNGPWSMGAFDVFALPSRYEGLPYVLLEAIGQGLPIVTTAIGGASELIRQGKNGYIVPVGDPTAFGSALAGLASSGRLCRQMGAASRARAALFTKDRMVKDIESVYRCPTPPREHAR